MKISDLKSYKVIGTGEIPQIGQTSSSNFQQKASNVLGSVFGGKKIGGAIGTQIAKAKATPEERPFVEAGPSAKQVVGDVAGVGLTLASLGGAGVAGGFASRLLKMAGLGAGISASQALEEGGNIGDVAKSAVAGGAVGAAMPVVGVGLKAIGKQIEQLPSRFVNSALSRGKAQVLQDIAKDNVDDFAKYVTENKGALKTANTHLLETQASVKSLSERVNTALAESIRKTGGRVTIGRNNLLDEIAKLPEAEGALLKRNDIRGIIERLAPQTKKLLQKESLNLTEANRLRQLLDGTLGDRAFLGGQLSSDKAVLKSFANTLRNTVKAKAPEGTKALFSELSNEIRFRDGLLERIAKKQGNQVLSFGDFIGGGLGGIFGGGLPGAFAGVATRRAIESVPFKLSAAKVVDAATKLEPVIQQLTPAQQTAILTFFADVFAQNQQANQEETP